jgi:adenosylcobinamide-GDP ribazoletransferase
MRDAGLAISLLTAVPTRAVMPVDDAAPQVAGWFPAVGLALGALGYGFARAMRLLPLGNSQPLLVAALIIVGWALATRMLHFDGLGDVADGYWGSHDRLRRLEIMSDSHTGAFGVTGIALTALLETAAISAILTAPHLVAILAVPALARFSATAGCWLGKPAREGGLGRSVMARPTVLGALPAVLVLGAVAAALWLGLGVRGAALFAFGVLTALAIPHLLSLRFGGVTGDVLGASVLLTETVLFVAFAIVG